jgi:hypothetical protein
MARLRHCDKRRLLLSSGAASHSLNSEGEYAAFLKTQQLIVQQAGPMRCGTLPLCNTHTALRTSRQLPFLYARCESKKVKTLTYLERPLLLEAVSSASLARAVDVISSITCERFRCGVSL